MSNHENIKLHVDALESIRTDQIELRDIFDSHQLEEAEINTVLEKSIATTSIATPEIETLNLDMAKMRGKILTMEGAIEVEIKENMNIIDTEWNKAETNINNHMTDIKDKPIESTQLSKNWEK